jgi:hypothetical protein
MPKSQGSAARIAYKKEKNELRKRNALREEDVVSRPPFVFSSGPTVVRLPSAPSPPGLGSGLPVVRLPGMPLKRPQSPEAHYEPHVGSSPAPSPRPLKKRKLSGSSLELEAARGLASRLCVVRDILSSRMKAARNLSAHMGGPQFDQRTKPVVTPVGIPTTTAGVDLGVMTHAPSGQASMSGLVIPRASSNAGSQQKPFRSSDSLEEVNRVLVREGFLEFDKMSNQEVIRRYGVCSAIGHQLRLFCSAREGLRASLDSDRTIATTTGADGCQNATTQISYQKRRKCTEPGCQKIVNINIKGHRLSALLAEPVQNAWMGFLFADKTSPRSRLFHGSHTCSTASPNHCMREEHVFLETLLLNSERSPHQTGANNAGICYHNPPCLGEKVKRPPPTS